MSDLAKKLAIILVLSSTIVGCSKKEEGAASDASVETESAAPNSETMILAKIMDSTSL